MLIVEVTITYIYLTYNYFFFNDTAPTEIYTYCHTLSLHDALPISREPAQLPRRQSPVLPPGSPRQGCCRRSCRWTSRLPDRHSRRSGRRRRSEEHTSELQSLMRISYAVFCLKKKTNKHNNTHIQLTTTQNTSNKQAIYHTQTKLTSHTTYPNH